MKEATRKAWLVTIIGASIVPWNGATFAAEPFYGNYATWNTPPHSTVVHECLAKSQSICPMDQEVAVAFTVPNNPPINYKLDRIELTLKQLSSNNQLTFYLLNDDPSDPGHPDPNFNYIESIPMNNLMVTNQYKFLVGLSIAGTTLHPTLQAGKTYWLVPSIAQNFSAAVLWPENETGVIGKRARRANVSATWAVTNGPVPVFRIVGTPVPAQPIKPSYSSYTAPSGGGPATVYLELVCANLSNPFTMPVSVSLLPNRSPAQVCQDLKGGINACGCPCWGACPSTPPLYGFQADCGGSVLRVTNSTVGVCSGAGGGPFVCADHADGLTKYSARKQLEGVRGSIAMEIRGVASGVPRDSNVSNIVDVTRTLRCGPDFSPRTYEAQVTLATGMKADQVVRSLAEAFTSQGDMNVIVEGNRVMLSPPCERGDYDVAFQSNDTGIDYAFSPPFEYSFLDYVARFSSNQPNKCLAGKVKCVSEKVSCLLSIEARARKKGRRPNAATLQKCMDKFDGDPYSSKGCFAKLEANKDEPCVTFGDTVALEAKIDAFVDDVVMELDPNPANDLNRCTAGKIKCVSKRDECILGVHTKAFKTGLPADAAMLQKCRGKFDGGPDPKKGCFAKLEAKGGCLTNGDTAAMETKSEAFDNDVLSELNPAGLRVSATPVTTRRRSPPL